MECLECGMEYDEDFDDECPYCGCSKDAVVCPDCNSVVDDDNTCSVCGYMFHDEYETTITRTLMKKKMMISLKKTIMMKSVKTAPTGRHITSDLPTE